MKRQHSTLELLPWWKESTTMSDGAWMSWARWRNLILADSHRVFTSEKRRVEKFEKLREYFRSWEISMTNIEDGWGSGKIDNTIFISQLDVFFYVVDNNIEHRRKVRCFSRWTNSLPQKKRLETLRAKFVLVQRLLPTQHTRKSDGKFSNKN